MKVYINGKKEKSLTHGFGKRFKSRIDRKRLSRKKTIKSKQETQIAIFLQQNNILFESEYAPEGLLNPKTYHPLFFDFYLPEYDAVIEYDGAQHFIPLHGKKQLEEIKYRDKIKTLFCRYQGIKILRIPYTCKDIELEICRFFDKHYPISPIPWYLPVSK